MLLVELLGPLVLAVLVVVAGGRGGQNRGPSST